MTKNHLAIALSLFASLALGCAVESTTSDPSGDEPVENVEEALAPGSDPCFTLPQDICGMTSSCTWDRTARKCTRSVGYR